MKVVVTGADGFIGKNIRQRLIEQGETEVVSFTRRNHVRELPALLADADAVVHLAGINRPQDLSEFHTGNVELTHRLCEAVVAATSRGRKMVVIFSSSTQVEREGAYGSSKRAAETAVRTLAPEKGVLVRIFRLPNVFGKWARPNYNSVVATFCYNATRNLPIVMHDPNAEITLVHVDDVVRRMCAVLNGDIGNSETSIVEPEFKTTVADLATAIRGFAASRDALSVAEVGRGFWRALYATYVSYLPPQSFSYAVPVYSDPRGVFVEMLKTSGSGQFSFFTANPGATRGGHYHHTKTEKFLVLRGHARFRFRNILSGETCALETSGDRPEIVDTIPGWSHDITNIGDEQLYVMLWANEIFDRDRPDTFACPI